MCSVPAPRFAPGGGGLQAIHEILDILWTKTVTVNAAGCMPLLSVYPSTPFFIWKANHPAYLAVSGSEPLDLARKIEKAKAIKGPSLIIAFSPCPTGWHYPPQKTIEIGRLAINTGVWPLKEYEDGKVVHTRIPTCRPPVTRYLKKQGRFAHLFQPENEYLIKEMQAELEAYWSCVEKNEKNS
jgi:pyruvate ferredoxin oxidoreductase beta subunit